jgi:serine/threonine-protein kinase
VPGPPPDPEPPVTQRLPAIAPLMAATPQVGGRLGKCQLTAVLGSGGDGLVFRAVHTTLEVPVAVKVLLHDGRPPTGPTRDRLLREARALARLNHPNVIRVLDVDDGPFPFAVLEFVDGCSLADRLRKPDALTPLMAADVVAQAAHGLAAAWAAGLVHRDVKPGNILLADAGGVKVADLGLARWHDDPTVGTGIVGTAAYMAPEQAVDPDKVDFRADIYALGATFYQALTGRLPFPGRTAAQMLVQHATKPLVPPDELAPDRVPPVYGRIVGRMMAKRPDDRYPSYDALLADLFALPRPRPAGGPATLSDLD